MVRSATTIPVDGGSGFRSHIWIQAKVSPSSERVEHHLYPQPDGLPGSSSPGFIGDLGQALEVAGKRSVVQRLPVGVMPMANSQDGRPRKGAVHSSGKPSGHVSSGKVRGGGKSKWFSLDRINWISFTLGACAMFVLFMLADGVTTSQRGVYNQAISQHIREINARRQQAENMVLLLQERLAEEMRR